MRETLGRSFFLLAVVTAPWVGVGVIHASTGRDLGGGLQPSWLALALALVLGFPRLRALFGPQSSPGLLLSLTVAPLLAMFLSLAGLWLAPGAEPLGGALARWSRQVVQWLIMLAFVWGVVMHARSPGQWRILLDALFLGVLLQIVYSLVQAVDFWQPMALFRRAEILFTSNPSILASSERLYVNNVLQEFPRLRGTVSEPLYLGNYLVATWPFILMWRRPIWVRGGLALLMAILLMLTFSRGAWLGLASQVVALGVWWLWRYLKQGGTLLQVRVLLPLLILGLVLVIADALTGGFVHQRVLASFNGQDWSNLTRLYSMQAAWRAFLLSPVVGVGWGQFAFHFPLLVDPMGLQSQFSWPVVNNFPLQILCETGLVGLLVFLGLVYQWLRSALGKAPLYPQGSGRMDLPLKLAGLAVLGTGVQLLTFSQYNLPHIWLVLGLLLAPLVWSPARGEGAP